MPTATNWMRWRGDSALLEHLSAVCCLVYLSVANVLCVDRGFASFMFRLSA
ncbi:Uncharacterised protein [Mycobacteroides abscessus subsp. abscessus]|nr:Uncharacterised protein [Mycobacteroides abscessus subsp. abscessus]